MKQKKNPHRSIGSPQLAADSVPIGNKETTHTVRKFLDGFTKILETAYDISQTSSSPKAEFITRMSGVVSLKERCNQLLLFQSQLLTNYSCRVN